MDVPEEKEAVDAWEKGGRSARNKIDEGQKDHEVITREVCDDFQGKKHSGQKEGQHDHFFGPKGQEAAHKSILSPITSIGRFQNTPTPSPPQRPIENRYDFSDHEKISNHCFAISSISAYEVVSDVLSMTILNENGQDMSLLLKFFRTNDIYSKQKLQNKVSCRNSREIKQKF